MVGPMVRFPFYKGYLGKSMHRTEVSILYGC